MKEKAFATYLVALMTKESRIYFLYSSHLCCDKAQMSHGTNCFQFCQHKQSVLQGNSKTTVRQTALFCS